MTAASRSPFDFDSPIERRGSGCFKWDSNPSADTLPMFVADMDFKAPEPVLEALQQRVAHGVFGYTWVRDEYFDAVNNWFSRRHNFPIERDWILPTIGIVPAVSAILKAFTEDASSKVGVMVQTPVYHCFFSSIRRMGCDIVESPLVADAQGVYQIDFEQFEQQAALPTTRVFLLCHPHNPSGRVWSTHELIRMGEICAKHGVTVLNTPGTIDAGVTDVSGSSTSPVRLNWVTNSPALSTPVMWNITDAACISSSGVFRVEVPTRWAISASPVASITTRPSTA